LKTLLDLCGFFIFEKRQRRKMFMKKSVLCLVFSLLFLSMCSNAFAHFGMVIPSDSMVMPGESKIITLTTSFSHPMEVVGMEMGKPAQFGVVTGEKRHNLLGLLKETKVMGHKAWQGNYRINRPGVYIFYMEPTPYWEQAIRALCRERLPGDRHGRWKTGPLRRGGGGILQQRCQDGRAN
jgi:uncharacterized GH25 family protein